MTDEEISKEDTNEKVSNMNEEKSKKQSITWIVPVIAAALVLLAAFYLFTPETRTVGVSVPYQEAVYKTVDKTVYVNELRTENRIETVTKFRTLYSGTVDGYTITRAVSYDAVYTGTSFWGYSEYTVTVCWSTCNEYYRVRAYDISLTPEEVPYTENVQVSYQVTESVPKTIQESIIDSYDTKYRTEYKDVTKTRLEWLI